MHMFVYSSVKGVVKEGGVVAAFHAGKNVNFGVSGMARKFYVCGSGLPHIAELSRVWQATEVQRAFHESSLQ